MCQPDQGAAGRDSGIDPPRGSVLPDRRTTPRFTVLDHRGWLGQWSHDDFAVFEVQLLDLSRRGAAFETDTLSTEQPTALLGLHTLREDWCLEVKVVKIARGRRKRYRVHVAFSEPCHDEFYAAALHGPGPRGAGGSAGASACPNVANTR